MRAFITSAVAAVAVIIAVVAASIPGMDPSPTPTPTPVVGHCRIVMHADALTDDVLALAGEACAVLTYETAGQRAELLR